MTDELPPLPARPYVPSDSENIVALYSADQMQAYARAAIAAHDAKRTKTDRTGMTYYKNNDCKAPSADHPDCICWTPAPQASTVHEAKQTAEPVATVSSIWNRDSGFSLCDFRKPLPSPGTKLYTRPAPKREPLTPEQLDLILSTAIPGGSQARDWFLPHETARGLGNVRKVVQLMVEAAHGIKEAL